MTELTVYDKAKWHYEGTFPTGLSRHQAFVLTGMFLAWVIGRDLYSLEFAQDFEEEIQLVKTRQMTGSRLLEIADGVFASDMLSYEGNSFTQSYFYFERSVKYLEDFRDVLAEGLPSIYHVHDTWENYAKISAVIEDRYQEWLSRDRTI